MGKKQPDQTTTRVTFDDGEGRSVTVMIEVDRIENETRFNISWEPPASIRSKSDMNALVSIFMNAVKGDDVTALAIHED